MTPEYDIAITPNLLLQCVDITAPGSIKSSLLKGLVDFCGKLGGLSIRQIPTYEGKTGYRVCYDSDFWPEKRIMQFCFDQALIRGHYPESRIKINGSYYVNESQEVIAIPNHENS